MLLSDKAAGRRDFLHAATATTLILDSLPRDHRDFAHQGKVNSGTVPSQEVIKKHIDKKGRDNRFETAPHPVPRFQDRKAVPTY
jgi:hypothetical protein